MMHHFFPSNTPATYFAVEQQSLESVQDVAEAVLRTAAKAQIKFDFLEANGPLNIGALTFIRFRIDRTHAMDLASELLTSGRGAVWTNGTGYKLQCGKKVGRVPMTNVIVTPCPNDRVLYLGTRSKHWERQFLKRKSQAPQATV